MRCPVCTAVANHAADVPSDRACNNIARSGSLVAYFKCPSCGHVFAPAMCAMSPAWFAEHIYNDQYLQHDPEYDGTRAKRLARWLIYRYAFARRSIRHLDYGSGRGDLSSVLNDAGFDSQAYDPFAQATAPEGQFNLITAFEVFEHAPDPVALVDAIDRFLAPEGVVIFSTLLNDGQDIGDWWYAAPRNGHISLFSSRSIRRVVEDAGLFFATDGEGTHMFWRQLPGWEEEGLGQTA